MNRVALSKGLIIVTISLIAAFQCYWIARLYKQEHETLRRETDVLFRDVVYKLQLQRFKKDTALFKTGEPDNLFAVDVINEVKHLLTDSMVTKGIMKKDTGQKRIMISVQTQRHMNDNAGLASADQFNLPLPLSGPPMKLRYFSNNKNINDSLPLTTIDSAYKAELSKNNINIGYTLKYVSGKASDLKLPTIKPGELKTNFTFIGLSQSYGYQAGFDAPFRYLIAKLTLPLLISLSLIAFTIISFVFLYRNLLAQQRLAAIKNEFISNITHELKTPIATVNVAIEALRNFKAIQDPLKTKEYLDISASELQRLSLLVDKVLRLSMFENGEVELKKERFDLKTLTEEVLSIMQLQVDKQNATVMLKCQGDDFLIEADRMHITSVLYNLLDNALKYKKVDAEVEIALKCHRMHVELSIKDNGIGIPAAYKRRVFEKLFRVPTGDLHNIKGYGLGLSYVNHIIQRHKGFIEVDSELGKGSIFTVLIPYKEMDEIWFDEKRRIRKIGIRLPQKKLL